MFFLAELGKAENGWLFSGMNNNVDFSATAVGIAPRLKWSYNEKEAALYESEHAVVLLCLQGVSLPCAKGKALAFTNCMRITRRLRVYSVSRS